MSTLVLYARYLGLLLLLALAQFSAAQSLAPPLKEQSSIAQQAGAGARVLYAMASTTVNDDYSWESVEYFSIRINDIEAARDYGRLSIGYNHFYSNLELEFASVLTPDGVTKPVKDDAIQKRVGGSQDFYEDRSELVFSLPDISVGSILEFQYRRTSKKVVMPGLYSTSLLPYWYQPTIGNNGARIDPVHFASQQVLVADSIDLQSKVVGPLSPDYQRSAKADGVVHRWTWQQLSSVPMEAAMPPFDTFMSRVRLSTASDWSEVSNWTMGLVKDKIKSNPEVAAVASSLVPGDADRQQKITAVYGYLQENIRYVFAHLGRGGYEPHFAQEVIQQGYGDCKDQTILAIALLNELGIEAYPALVVTPRNSRPNMELVALYFDHMIVWIPPADDERGLWMDTTGDRALFPGVSNYLLNQPLLNVTGGDASLQTVNQQLAANSADIILHYSLSDNDRLTVDVAVSMTGVFEQNFRNWWISDANRETSLEQFMGGLFPDAKSHEIRDAEVINDKDLWSPAKVRARFEFGDVRQSKNDPLDIGASFMQAFRMFGGFNSYQIPRDRKARYVNEQQEVVRLVAHFPDSEVNTYALMGNGSDIANEFFSLQQSGQENADGSYTVTMDYRRKGLNLSVAEYDRFYQLMAAMSDAGNWVLRYVNDEDKQELAVLQQSAGDGSPGASFKQLRFHLDRGQFEQALSLATEAVESNSTSGEAWYLLGVAQGFSALIDESMDSFARAQELGYTP